METFNDLESLLENAESKLLEINDIAKIYDHLISPFKVFGQVEQLLEDKSDKKKTGVLLNGKLRSYRMDSKGFGHITLQPIYPNTRGVENWRLIQEIHSKLLKLRSTQIDLFYMDLTLQEDKRIRNNLRARVREIKSILQNFESEEKKRNQPGRKSPSLLTLFRSQEKVNVFLEILMSISAINEECQWSFGKTDNTIVACLKALFIVNEDCRLKLVNQSYAEEYRWLHTMAKNEFSIECSYDNFRKWRCNEHLVDDFINRFEDGFKEFL